MESPVCIKKKSNSVKCKHNPRRADLRLPSICIDIRSPASYNTGALNFTIVEVPDMRKSMIAAVIFAVLLSTGGCSAKKSAKFVRQGVPKGSQVGIIVDSQNSIKNAIIAKFLDKGFKVKAVNASDIYTLGDHFSIADYKYLAYQSAESSAGDGAESLSSTQKSYDSIYKLHVYNYEANKAEILAEMKSKWGLRYLVIMDLRDWGSLSWMRAIDLETYEIIAVENYATRTTDSIESVVDHFLETVSTQAQ